MTACKTEEKALPVVLVTYSIAEIPGGWTLARMNKHVKRKMGRMLKAKELATFASCANAVI